MELPVRGGSAVTGRFHGTSSRDREFRIRWVVHSFRVGSRELLRGEKNGELRWEKKMPREKAKRSRRALFVNLPFSHFLHNTLGQWLCQFSTIFTFQKSRYDIIDVENIWGVHFWMWFCLEFRMGEKKRRKFIEIFSLFFFSLFHDFETRISDWIYVFIVFRTLTSLFN